MMLLSSMMTTLFVISMLQPNHHRHGHGTVVIPALLRRIYVLERRLMLAPRIAIGAVVVGNGAAIIGSRVFRNYLSWRKLNPPGTDYATSGSGWSPSVVTSAAGSGSSGWSSENNAWLHEIYERVSQSGNDRGHRAIDFLAYSLSRSRARLRKNVARAFKAYQVYQAERGGAGWSDEVRVDGWSGPVVSQGWSGDVSHATVEAEPAYYAGPGHGHGHGHGYASGYVSHGHASSHVPSAVRYGGAKTSRTRSSARPGKRLREGQTVAASEPLSSGEFDSLMQWAGSSSSSLSSDYSPSQTSPYESIVDLQARSPRVIRIKRQVRNKDAGGKKVVEAKDKDPFEKHLIQDITRFFDLVQYLDEDNCLQKLVCGVHSVNGTQSQTQDEYGYNLKEAFRVLESFMPAKTDSYRAYLKAARLGRKSPLKTCTETYKTCKHSADDLIGFSNDVETGEDVNEDENNGAN